MKPVDRQKTGAVDLRGEQIHWDLEGGLSYGSYLALERLLSAQTPLSTSHDEMLFIVIHQVSELWMKLSIHELTAVVKQIQTDVLDPAFKMLSRVARIQGQLIMSWDVLSTMTPSDYSSFRGHLERASGFQSYQYRTLEFILGNKNREMIEVHRSDEKIYRDLREVLTRPSLYDETVRMLKRRGFDIPDGHVERDWAEPYEPHAKVEAAWLEVYRDTQRYWDLYELAEKLVDLEQKFQQWRFSHMKTVERIIGYKRGTGGTGGVSYLQKALALKFFPELWSVRTST
ncbi:MAG TPA: tryptophan 2,3-dioxygenase [Vicinamibacteria bacterium]|nr:tryptophan 2,3-dioxygenase [Vicinamibacteria bacterium]